MNTIARMKAFAVDVDKQQIKVSLELPLQLHLVNGLGSLADGQQLAVTIEENQRELPLDTPPADSGQGDLFDEDDDTQTLIDTHAAVMDDLQRLGEDDQDGDITAELEAVIRELYSRGLVLQEANADGTFKWIDQETGEVVGANDDAVAAASE
jgi:hypothetical protein